MDLSLIEQLPNEILLKIILYTPLETLNKCFCVSKRFYYVMNKNVHYLPKIRITKYIIEQKDDEINLTMEKASYNAPKKVWQCTLTTDSPEQLSSSTDQVAEFYKNKGHTGLKWTAGSKSLEMPVSTLEKGLKDHISFICRRAEFLILIVKDITPANARMLRDVMKRCHSKAQNIKIETGLKLEEEHISFIKDSGCETLDIRRKGEVDVNLLFKDPSCLANVWSLTILRKIDPVHQGPAVLHERWLSEDQIELNDEFLLGIVADNIEIDCKTMVTHTGIIRIIQQFIERRRNIDLVKINLSFADVPDNVIGMMAFVENILQQVQSVPGVRPTDDNFMWKVDRLPQRLTVVFHPETLYLDIHKEEEDDFDEEEAEDIPENLDAWDD